MSTALFDTRPVQMNVRMNRQLKEAGDAVLSQLGMTPSQAVRSLWKYLVVQNRIPDGIESNEVDAKETQVTAYSNTVAKGPEIIRDFYRRADVTAPDGGTLPSGDDLYASAMGEKYRDWIYE